MKPVILHSTVLFLVNTVLSAISGQGHGSETCPTEGCFLCFMKRVPRGEEVASIPRRLSSHPSLWTHNHFPSIFTLFFPGRCWVLIRIKPLEVCLGSWRSIISHLSSQVTELSMVLASSQVSTCSFLDMHVAEECWQELGGPALCVWPPFKDPQPSASEAIVSLTAAWWSALLERPADH